MAEALYRKYRPQVFEDVVGQEPIERTLKNAIEQDKVSHAYLFTGPRGTGKTTTARLLAKALLCQSGPTPDPDGSCEDCQLIADGVHPDVYELDAASRTGVENVREEIISRVSFAPTRGRYKVYIIDEVHMLSTAAFNALLKTLEEPPSHVVFVLCTTDPQKVPETIHSRCQRFDFRRIAPEAMVSRLGAICIAEDVSFEGEALDLIAHRAEGGLRNALTSLEQIIAFENGKVTLAGAERLLGSIDSNDMAEIMAYIGKRDIANCFRWTANYVETGADLAQFVRDMAERVRNLYVMALVGDDVDLDIGETSRLELTNELQWFGQDRLARLMGVLGDVMAELKTSSNPRLAFEIALTRMVRPDSDLTIESLAERVEALESGYSAVAHELPGTPVVAGTAAEGSQWPGGDWNEGIQGESAGQAAFQQAEPRAAAMGQVRASQVEPASATATAQPTSQVANAAVATGAAASARIAEQAQPQQAGTSGGVGMPNQMASRGPDEQVPREAIDTRGVQAQPASAPAAAGSDERFASLSNPAALSRIWQATLSTLKKQKQSYGVLFMNTKAQFDVARSMVKVVFPQENTFAFNAVQKPDVQDALAAALEKSLGTPVPFMYEQAGSGAARAPQQAVQAQASYAAAQPTARETAQPMGGQRGGWQEARPAAQADSRQGMRQPGGQASQPARQAAPASANGQNPYPERSAAPAPASQGMPAYDDMVPYEEVPYEEVPYEEVPYEEFGGMGSPSPSPSSSPTPAQSGRPRASAQANSPASGAAVAAPASAGFPPQPSATDVSTAASPAEPNLTPSGEIAEDPAGVEALLQAGFGGGVVFSEVEGDEF